MSNKKVCECKWVQITKKENGNIIATSDLVYCEQHKPKVDEEFARKIAADLEKAKRIMEKSDELDIKMAELERLHTLPKTPESERQIADLMAEIEAM